MYPGVAGRIAAERQYARLIYSYENGYTTEHEEYLIQDGEVVVNLGAYSALVLKNMEF